MTVDTTTLSYWMNWSFFLCALFIIFTLVLSSVLIWKYEGSRKRECGRQGNQREPPGTVYKDDAWNTWLKQINPIWLLVFRIFTFCVLLALLTVNIVHDGGGIFYFYTQWTFTLVTVYFGVAVSFSIAGCCQSHKKSSSDGDNRMNVDAERGIYWPPSLDETIDIPKSTNAYEKPCDLDISAICGYAFQIIFQTCAGAVVLTDVVFWLVLYPFMMSEDRKLNILDICLHSVNAVFLLGDTILNSLQFPMFRIAYFILWTSVFVVFQWIIHACVSLWWPYTFLDLSSPYAPLWYVGVGLMHIPCYAIFALIIKLKNFWLSRSFPASRRCSR